MGRVDQLKAPAGTNQFLLMLKQIADSPDRKRVFHAGESAAADVD